MRGGPHSRPAHHPWLADKAMSNANITGAPSDRVVTLHAVVTRADGTVEDLGVIATSDPQHTPLTPRKDTDGSKQE